MFYLKSNTFYIFNDKFCILQEVFLIQTAFHSHASDKFEDAISDLEA